MDNKGGRDEALPLPAPLLGWKVRHESVTQGNPKLRPGTLVNEVAAVDKVSVKKAAMAVVAAIALLIAYSLYHSAKTRVVLNNSTGGTATLITAVPNGQLADGSTSFIYNTGCVAAPHGTCSAIVYLHRGLQVSVNTKYIFLPDAASPSYVVNSSTVVDAFRNTGDSNCCYLTNPTPASD